MTSESPFHYDGHAVKGKAFRVGGVIALGIFVLCIPAFLICGNLRWAVNSVWLYDYEFGKHRVSEATGMSDEELRLAARELIHYFNSAEEPIETTVTTPQGAPLFNEREIEHLDEIKGLIRLCYNVQVGAAGYIGAFVVVGFILLKRRFWYALARGLFGGGVLTIAVFVAVGVAALASFDWLFLGFHHLFFRSDTWILNPATDYLIMIFPEGFFYDVGLYVVGAIVVEAVVLGGIGGFCLLRRRKAGG